MAAISFAILGKNNEPLYVREFLDHPQGSRRVSDDDLFGLSHCADSGKYQSQDAETPFATTTAERRKPGAFGRLECSIQQQFILHSAVDRFEELSGPSGYGWRSPGVTGTEAMFVGLLEPVENTRVYGYMTTTQIRFLLAVDDQWSVSSARDPMYADDVIKRLFAKLHRLYVEHMLNPFCAITGPIQSSKFDRKVQECVAAFNRSVIE